MEAAGHQVGGYHGDQQGGAVDYGAEGDYQAVLLLLEVVAHFAHCGDAVGGGYAGDQFYAVQVPGAAQEGFGFGAEAGFFGFGQAAAEQVGVGHIGVQAGFQFGDRGLEFLGYGLQGGGLLYEQIRGGRAG